MEGRKAEDSPPPQVARPQAGLLAWIEYAGFRLVAAVARTLPLDVASGVSGQIWRWVAPRLRRHRRARANIAASLPEVPEDRREAILLDMWEGLGRTFGEAFHLRQLSGSSVRIAVDLPAEVEQAIRSGGLVFASLHLGNWEVAVAVPARMGLPVAGVYQSLKNPLVDDYITSLRAFLYPAGLFRKGHDTVFRLIRIVRSGQGVAVLADLREHRGIVVPFFGRPAPSNHFPALLARSQKVPLVAGRVIRTKGANFVIKGEIVPVPRTADRDDDVATATAALHATFERWIRENPEQWMWAHRRWG